MSAPRIIVEPTHAGTTIAPFITPVVRELVLAQDSRVREQPTERNPQ